MSKQFNVILYSSISWSAIGDDDLRETTYEILLAVVGASRGLIVLSKEKKKEKKFRLMRKLGHVHLNMLEEGLIHHPVVGLGEQMRNLCTFLSVPLLLKRNF